MSPPDPVTQIHYSEQLWTSQIPKRPHWDCCWSACLAVPEKRGSDASPEAIEKMIKSFDGNTLIHSLDGKLLRCMLSGTGFVP